MSTPGVGPSQPEDVTGDGVATLADRVEPGGQGSPDTNQGKAEPIAGSPSDPVVAPSLEDMSIGRAPTQLPSVGLDVAAPASGEVVDRLAAESEVPVGGSGDEVEDAHRTPGSLGATPEPIGTDVEGGAARMATGDATTGGGGDAAGVPVTGDAAAAGTSEEQGVVRGARPAEPE